MIYNQMVTWTAFAILAMFSIYMMILGESSIWYGENGSDGESKDKRKDKSQEGSDEKVEVGVLIILNVLTGLTDWTGLTI